jgi:hypothetical protein
MTAATDRRSDLLLGIGVAAGLIAVAFVTTGGVGQVVTGADTWAEITVTLLGAGVCAAVVVLGARGRRWGAVTVALFAALTGLTALSITWSVQPDFSWFGANQMLSYLAVFAAAAAIARLAPQRWRSLIGGLALAMVGLSAYTLLAKVFPGTLSPNNTVGRVQEPFGYWNAIGVCGALGVPACLWSGARRDGSSVSRALSAPALSLLIAVVVLSYSRSALLVAVVGAGCWLALVPLRMRATAILVVGAAGAAGIAGWALSTRGLSDDNISLAQQTSAGHTFGLVLIGLLTVVAGAGFAVTAAIDRATLSPASRRRLGTILVVAAAMLPVAAIVALAVSSRGLTGQISHVWHSLTNVNGVSSNTAGRIFQFGNSRPRYWHEGIVVGEHALLHGVGALGYGTARVRYVIDTFKVDHAHSYLVETFADLGLIGLALTIALLVAWCMAAARALAWRTPWRSLSSERGLEREGLVTVAVVVVMFGLQSAIDWTWYFPGVAIPTLVCAGWLAGRGPLNEPAGRLRDRPSLLARPLAGFTITGLATVALLAAWLMWQPLRSADAASAAIGASTNPAAFADARSAAGSDPLAYQPLFELSALYQRIGDRAAARAELVHATQVQSQNPETWVQLGSFDLAAGKPRSALADLAVASVLDPQSPYVTGGIAAARAALAAK